MLIVEFLVIHSIQEEIEKVQYYRFSAFFFNRVDDVVVCVRVILYENLPDNSYLRLFDVDSFYLLLRQLCLPRCARRSHDSQEETL